MSYNNNWLTTISESYTNNSKPLKLDEGVLLEQRLTYAKDICEAVGLEPQELLEMLQDLIEVTTYAANVAKGGEKYAFERAQRLKNLLDTVKPTTPENKVRADSMRMAGTGAETGKNVVGVIDKGNQAGHGDIAIRMGHKSRNIRRVAAADAVAATARAANLASRTMS